MNRIGLGYDVHAFADGRKLIFNVIAHDDFGPVGEGVHERFVINNDKFMSKVAEKQVALQMHSAE